MDKNPAFIKIPMSGSWKQYPHHVNVRWDAVLEVEEWLNSKYEKENDQWRSWAITTFGFKSEKDAIWVALKWGL